MRPHFYKMTGSGNDFVFLDGRHHRLADWPAERIRAVCDRRQGVGGDGLVHVSTVGPATLRMVYFNADGSRADMCGNAALCATRLGAYLGLVGPERVDLVTDAGQLESRCVGPGWAAELRFPRAQVPAPLKLKLAPGERRAFQGTVGVPHTVVLVEDIAGVDVAGRGRELRFADEFAPHGSNINFIGPLKGADADWGLRTYERGVEAETLACGTGTVAAALAFAAQGLCQLPVRIRSGSGAVYSISGVLIDAQSSEDVWLCGEGRLVFEGSSLE